MCIYVCSLCKYTYIPGVYWHFTQLHPDDVKFDSHGITKSKLLKVAVPKRGYPPSITCAVTFREELRRVGGPVWVCLDLIGAGKELTFTCKAYEELRHQLLDGSESGELE